jgi:hypothetical protein
MTARFDGGGCLENDVIFAGLAHSWPDDLSDAILRRTAAISGVADDQMHARWDGRASLHGQLPPSLPYVTAEPRPPRIFSPAIALTTIFIVVLLYTSKRCRRYRGPRPTLSSDCRKLGCAGTQTAPSLAYRREASVRPCGYVTGHPLTLLSRLVPVGTKVTLYVRHRNRVLGQKTLDASLIHECHATLAGLVYGGLVEILVCRDPLRE